MLIKRSKRLVEHNTAPVIIFKMLIVVALFLYCVSLIVPLIWMINTSLKDEISYTIDNFGFPTNFVFGNYVDVLTKYLYVEQNGFRYGIGTLFFNSIVMSLGFAIVGVFSIVVVAYVMARYDFVGNKFIYSLGLVIMVMPIIGSLPSQYRIYRALGIYDNMFLMIITSSSVPFSGMWFLIIYSSFKSIPKDFTEAAEIDGAGYYRIMFTIIIPMILPVAATLFVLNFIANWNNYQTPLIWLPSYPNLPYGMYRFQMGATGGGSGAGMTIVMAGFVCVMLPTILIYIFSQKIINSNFVTGGIKM